MSLIKEDIELEITTMNAKLLAKMFLAGAARLEAKKEWIYPWCGRGLQRYGGSPAGTDSGD